MVKITLKIEDKNYNQELTEERDFFDLEQTLEVMESFLKVMGYAVDGKLNIIENE